MLRFALYSIYFSGDGGGNNRESGGGNYLFCTKVRRTRRCDFQFLWYYTKRLFHVKPILYRV